MAYLSNRVVNLLNLHYGIHALVISGAGAFFSVYLLKAGVPTPFVFMTFALVLLGRLVIRPLVLVMALRWGLRGVAILGTIVAALPYLIVAEVHGVDLALVVLIVASSIGETLYWTSYHAYFAALGDTEHRGHQIGAREALASIAAILGPLLCGWTLVALGPRPAFWTAAVVQGLAALPFLGTPDVAVKKEAPGALRAGLPGILLFFADGWTTTGMTFVWQIALFVLLGESFAAFGGAMALAGLVGAVGGLVLGRHIDLGHGARSATIAYAALAALTLLRAAATNNVALAVTANAFGPLVSTICVPVLMTAIYNLSKRSPCPVRFQIAAEGGWDMGGASAALLAAALSATGFPLSSAIIPALLGVFLSIHLLLRYYGIKSVPALEAPPA
jgi:DHA1 family inner membrane transport protein